MLLKEVMFDDRSPYWTNNRDYNWFFLSSTEQFINQYIQYQGSVSLEKICELLGVGCDSEDKEKYMKRIEYNPYGYIEFETFHQPNNAYLIHILYSEYTLSP